MNELNNSKKKIEIINKLLIERFGIPPRNKKPPAPVDLLIGTILSQNTNDNNSYKAFQNLKNNFSFWEDVAKLTPKQIEKYVKTAGLGKQKSGAIKNLLNSLLEKKGKISLSYLKKMTDDEILKELTSYKGIGIKTASCVLLFAFRKNVCPVDTHVHRTTNRIGLVNTKSPDKTFYALQGNMPENTAHSFHTNLIRLGREVCLSQKPKCGICPLIKICKYENKNLGEKKKSKERDFMLLDSIK
ncbi:MAG TPA: endonuclease III [Ignavibacteria bacterium]|nr:endonuclease III [Ignavibacteria bacterium]